MNWLSDITPPGIKKIFRQQDSQPDGLWTKCPSCDEMLFQKDLAAAKQVCPTCDHHLRLTPVERLDDLFDDAHWERVDLPSVVDDPLKFRDSKKYSDRLRDSRKKTGEQDAMVVARGTVDGMNVVASVQNFDFMGGSMGMALGESFIAGAEAALADNAAYVVFAASGGARMQEGILSLMQMPRTTVAVQMLKDAGLPYIVVLTHPTTGGVTASYAMLGDVHLAEPNALICFAGPRVIEQTIREKLPEGFQRSEYLLDKGMIDQVVHRHELRGTLVNLIGVLTGHFATNAPAVEEDASEETEASPPKARAELVTSDQLRAESDATDLPKAAE